MNRIIAALATAILLTTAVTAYAQTAPAQVRDKLMWCVMYPPVGCADNEAISGDKDIVVKFKIVELYKDIKNAFR